jgi:hypothetical protein
MWLANLADITRASVLHRHDNIASQILQQTGRDIVKNALLSQDDGGLECRPALGGWILSAAGEEESFGQNRLIEDREELSSRQAMEASYIHQDGIWNLRYLPGSDSENDSKLERSVSSEESSR